MDYKDIKNKSEKELHAMLGDERNSLRDLRFRAGEHQLKKVSDINNARKGIAKILTALKSRANMQISGVAKSEEV